MNRLLITGGGYVAAAILFFLWLDGRENLAAQIEQCNTDKMASIAEASELARSAERAANAERLAQLSRAAMLADEARKRAVEAMREAEAKPAVIREVIKRVADENVCLDTGLPAALVEQLRQ